MSGKCRPGFIAPALEVGGLVAFLTLPLESEHASHQRLCFFIHKGEYHAYLWALLGGSQEIRRVKPMGNTRGRCHYQSLLSESPSHPPQHRGCTYFFNKSMLRTYYVQRTYCSVINTDLVPAHTAQSGGDGCDSKDHTDT